MLRSFFITLSKADWARQLIVAWKPAWRMASRFIAGETLAAAVKVIQGLNTRGIYTTLDHLGEHTTTQEEAVQAATEIIAIFDEIERQQVQSNVSVKLSQIGLSLDLDLCEANLLRILEHARELNNFVRVDMEDSTTVDATLQIYRKMVQEHGFTNLGLVFQSYLYRTKEDIVRLGEIGTPVRLCKGAYKEPSEVAFPAKADVDQNYDDLTALLMEISRQHEFPEGSQDGRVPPIPAIATHDEKRINFAKQYAEKFGIPRTAFEFQMLHGIRRDLQLELVREGYRVRIYVPFGTQWYPYFMRRLAERPANIWFFLSNYFKK